MKEEVAENLSLIRYCKMGHTYITVYGLGLNEIIACLLIYVTDSVSPCVRVPRGKFYCENYEARLSRVIDVLFGECHFDKVFTLQNQKLKLIGCL